MPTRADLQAAVPKCSYIAHSNPGTPNRCGAPMVYSVDGNVWKCPRDGTALKGLLMAEWAAAPDDLKEAA